MSCWVHAIHHLKRLVRRGKHDGAHIVFAFYSASKYFRRNIVFILSSKRVDWCSSFTSKGQLAFWPQVKVTWWPRGHQVSHFALSHIIRGALTRRVRWRFLFLDIFILTWDMLKRKFDIDDFIVTSRLPWWRQKYFNVFWMAKLGIDGTFWSYKFV